MIDFDYSLSEYTEEQKQALISRPAIEDLDSGPYNAWYWAHANDTYADSIYGGCHKWLRMKGYVMWDDSRLNQEWKLFETPYEDAEDDSEDHLSRLTIEEIHHSYDRRSWIRARGGRGWWSKDDESKIDWRESGPCL